jgi:hypothetical protein
MKEMCWLPYKGNQLNIALHLREYPHQSWKIYTASPYAVPDYNVPRGSKGWATFQKLRQIGWTLISSERAKLPTSLVIASHQGN